jgi:hypothetical protein
MTQQKPTGSEQQIEKFRDLARELEADEDEAHFEDAVRRVARTPKPVEPAKDP